VKELRPSRWKTPLIFLFVVLLLVEFVLVVRQEEAQSFAAAAQKEASRLIDFAQTRAKASQRESNESFARYEQRISTEDEATQALYSKLFAAKVAHMRDEFARRGFTKSELDEFYQKPGSTIAIYAIGRALSDMSAELGARGMLDNWKRKLARLRHHSSSPA
jgi:hypothetical protein